jgi:hypothetical protein
MFAWLNKVLPVLPLVTKIVDTLFPFAVGKRTAVVVLAQAGVTVARAFGVEVPTTVDQALAVAGTAAAAAHVGREEK